VAEITDELKQQILKEVKAEFPDDEMLQEIHYIHLLHYYQLLIFLQKNILNSLTRLWINIRKYCMFNK
jgi:hypothetical protein